MTYDYDVKDCDVEDKVKLQQFREKREEWYGWLIGDEQHAIWNQISNMLWNDATYRLINKCRGHGAKAPDDYMSNSFLIGSFIDQGYITTQIMAIRRLIDPQARRDDRQPISIKRILADLRDHVDLVSRENFVSFDAAPYDYAKAEEAWLNECLEEHGDKKPIFRGIPTSGPMAWSSSHRRHETFDKLSGVSSENRTRGDLLSVKTIDRLSQSLGLHELAQVSVYSDKFIAHAADPSSREPLSADEIKISIGMLNACHRALVSVAKTVSELIFLSGHSEIPAPQFNIVEHFTHP
jgi:hypothetical protein